MTRTDTDLARVLTRAWDRAVQDPADKLDPELARKLADAVAAQVNGEFIDNAAADELLVARDTALHDLGEVRAERDEAVAALSEARTLLARVRDELVLADSQLEECRAAAVSVGLHEHRYPWPGLSGPIEPCVCGKPYPRTQTRGSN